MLFTKFKSIAFKSKSSAIAFSIAATVAAFTFAVPAHAQTYPDKSIRLLQGFAPGGNADTIARLVGGEISKGLGQPIVVEALAGAGGTIAATTIAKAKPDGYNLLLATGGHAVAGALYNSLGYKTVQDFEMISTITYFPFLIVVPNESKFASFSALLAEAKSNPGKIAYGTAGIGSTHHLAGELLASMGKVDLLHVAYKGDAASMTGLMTGDIPFIIAPPTVVLGNVRAGKLRVLAVTGPQRWAGMPQVPTVAEQGISGYDVRSWAGLMAPAGTPKSIVDRLNTEVQKALQIPAVRTRLEEMGGIVRGSTAEEMRVMVANQTDKWISVVNEAKIPK